MALGTLLTNVNLTGNAPHDLIRMDTIGCLFRLYPDSATVLFCFSTWMIVVHTRCLRRRVDRYRRCIMKISYLGDQTSGDYLVYYFRLSQSSFITNKGIRFM